MCGALVNPIPKPPERPKAKVRLFDLDLGASAFKLGLKLSSIFFADCFFDGLGRALNHFLGFFKAKSGDLTNCFDHVDFLSTRLREDYVELSLLFCSCCVTAASYSATSYSNWCCADAPLLLELRDKLCDLDNGKV